MSNQSPKRTIVPGNWGFFPELALRVKLILRLMTDRRVNPLIKVLPVAALVYLVVPTDLLPLLPFDDAAILWMGGAMFIELCPKDVVQEHTNALRMENQRADMMKDQFDRPPQQGTGDIVDAEYRDLSGKRAGKEEGPDGQR